MSRTGLVEKLTHELQRRTVLRVLHSHPDWTLDEIGELVESEAGAALGELTVGELIAGLDGELVIDRGRRRRALGVKGAEFDALVLEVLVEARPRMVAAAYLRDRVGGPRWKLQNALGRLVRAGRAHRVGNTSDRRYGAGEEVSA